VVYDRPLSVFAAGFIGSLAMNFLDGTVGQSEGQNGVATPIGFISLDKERSDGLDGMQGRAVRVGIRPQNITYVHHVQSRRSSDTHLDFLVELIESMGDRSLVVAKATANVTLGNLSAVYNGSPKAATASTDPAGLTVNLTYNGSSTPPTAVGTYAVIGTVQDANYQGTGTGNLVIGAAVTAKGIVLVDFGTIQTTSPTGGLYWNNCTSVGTLTNLVTTNNTKSGFTLTLTNGSFGGGDWVPVMTAQMGLFQVSNAARDGLISVPGDGVRSVKIGGLNANLTYRLGVYAGRSINEKRATLYRVRGATTNSGALTTSGSGISSVNYNNRNILTFTNLVPDSTGALYLDYQTMVGSYAHLNAISIEEVAPGGSAGPRMDSVLVDFGGVTTPNPTSAHTAPGRAASPTSHAILLIPMPPRYGGCEFRVPSPEWTATARTGEPPVPRRPGLGAQDWRITAAMCSMASRASGSSGSCDWKTWNMPSQTSSVTSTPSARALAATRTLSSRMISCSPT